MEATLHQLKLKVGEQTVNELLRVLCKIASTPSACQRCGLDVPAAAASSSSGPRAEPEGEQLVGGFSKDDLMRAIAYDFDDADEKQLVPTTPPQKKKASSDNEEESALAKSCPKKSQKKRRRVVSSEEENADEDIFT